MTDYDLLRQMQYEAKQCELFAAAVITETDGREVDQLTMHVIKHAVELNDLAWARIRRRGALDEIH